jgi:thiol:disulfide interchange protein
VASLAGTLRVRTGAAASRLGDPRASDAETIQCGGNHPMTQRVSLMIALCLTASACGSEPRPPPPSPALAATTAPAAVPQDLAWTTDEVAAFARARAEHKGVLVEFSATWCVPCEELDKAFRTGATHDLIAGHFVPLKVDVSDDSAASAAQRDRYRATTLPAVVFLTTDGRVVGRVTQVLDADALLRVVQAAADAVRQDMPMKSANP